VASGGRAEHGSRPRARTASVVIPFPRGQSGGRLDLVRLVPSGRSILLAFAILAGALFAWLAARETGVFAVRTLDVEGAPPAVAVAVHKTLAANTGTSLLKLDVGAAERAVESLPTVAAVTFDRAFPHTLRIIVVPERPVAVVRQGPASYLLSARGRVISPTGRRSHPKLARIWIRRTVHLDTGGIAEGDLLSAVTSVAPLAGSHFPGRVISVTTGAESLTMTLRSGLELRLGEPFDVGLKLAVAAEVIPRLADGTAYLDVAVPDRPVAG
jgi:cell division protein FtsQ